MGRGPTFDTTEGFEGDVRKWLDGRYTPILARGAIASARAVGGATTMSSNGIALTDVGTATAATVATTNVHTMTQRVEYAVTVAATSAVAGFREGANKFARGHANGGFHLVSRFGPSRGTASNATRRMFVGFTSSVANPTDVNPSTINDCLGVGADAADTNWQIMHRTGAGSVVKVDTGIAKSAADNTEMYELEMLNAPGGSTVDFKFTRLATGVSFEHTATADLPSATTLLSARGWASVGGTNSVIGMSLGSLYIRVP